MNLNCVITDDEPIALEILEDYIRLVPGLNLVAKCRNAMETLTVLRQNEVDVLFIDIQMPEISGLDFIRSLTKRPAVVFTTAFPNYAIDGFEVDAVDYLLKPISIERFLRAIDKVFGRTAQNESEQKQLPDKKFFFIKSNTDLVKIEYETILYIEGLENYVKIHCETKTIISFSTMKNMEDILTPHRFLRIHRSFLINLNKVSSVQNNSFRIDTTDLIIGKSYRKTVSEVLKTFYSI
ncbi:MAG: two component transcriptional regulator, LytTR family [Flavipsychrobacter sp.]|nr:two component transcriptional regulator, LytTR family [Flavipsychrobacter sp.]